MSLKIESGAILTKYAQVEDVDVVVLAVAVKADDTEIVVVEVVVDPSRLRRRPDSRMITLTDGTKLSIMVFSIFVDTFI